MELPLILVTNNQSKIQISISDSIKSANRILAILKINNVELSILFVDDEEMQLLNSRYRNINKTTDVLSFPQLSFPLQQDISTINSTPDTPSVLLGDIVISLEVATRQAIEQGCSLQEELDRLLTHGTLHLLGYDHENVSNEKRKLMEQKEEVIYRSL